MEEETNCPHGYEFCNEDDYESICDACREAKMLAYVDAIRDTYD